MEELEMGKLSAAPPMAPTTGTIEERTPQAAAELSSSSSPSIVDEARECLAQSNLMFLYADLRLLSATGRINTKFETLCIDSDRVPRTTASQMAQLPDESSSHLNMSKSLSYRSHNGLLPSCEGVSPAQIMAILIVELRKEVMAQRQRAKAQIQKENEQPGLLSSVVGGAPNICEGGSTGSDSKEDDDDDDDAGVMNKLTNAKGRKDFETGMHQMVRAHNDMLYKDMKGMPEVQVSRAVFQKNPLKKLQGKQISNKQFFRTSGVGNVVGEIRDNLRGVFSNDPLDDGDNDGSLCSKGSKASLTQSWLSLRKSSNKSPLPSPLELDDENIDDGRSDNKTESKQQQQGVGPSLGTVVAIKTLFRKKSSEKTPDVGTMTIDVKAPPPDEEQKQVNNQRLEQMSSGLVSRAGPARQLSLISEDNEDETLEEIDLKKKTGGGDNFSNETTPPVADTSSQDDIFKDTDKATPAKAQKIQFMDGNFMGGDTLEGTPRRQRPPMGRASITRQLTTKINQYREDHTLYNKGMIGFIPTDDWDTFNGAENVGDQLMRMRNSICVSASHTGDFGDSISDLGRNMSEKELLDYMTKCIESREPDRLDFMSDFFRDNTVSHTMVKSKTRIVWMQDWFPIKDPVYGIAVDKEKKRVLVVFRGAITKPDWGHAFDHDLIHYRNPVKDTYEGKSNTIKLHRGFYRYLLRTRKDTGSRKYDEIANKAYEYGSKMIGDDFTVTVNGYSLGGAMSMLFGFYASNDERFTKNGPVKIFTYGAPYVGGHTFADAFRYQETARKVQCARFYNSNDIGKYHLSQMFGSCEVSLIC